MASLLWDADVCLTWGCFDSFLDLHNLGKQRRKKSVWGVNVCNICSHIVQGSLEWHTWCQRSMPVLVGEHALPPLLLLAGILCECIFCSIFKYFSQLAVPYKLECPSGGHALLRFSSACTGWWMNLWAQLALGKLSSSPKCTGQEQELLHSILSIYQQRCWTHLWPHTHLSHCSRVLTFPYYYLFRFLCCAVAFCTLQSWTSSLWSYI